MEHDSNGGERRHGYRPLVLTLTGFKGIRSGLGRDTVTLNLEQLAVDRLDFAATGVAATDGVAG